MEKWNTELKYEDWGTMWASIKPHFSFIYIAGHIVTCKHSRCYDKWSHDRLNVDHVWVYMAWLLLSLWFDVIVQKKAADCRSVSLFCLVGYIYMKQSYYLQFSYHLKFWAWLDKVMYYYCSFFSLWFISLICSLSWCPVEPSQPWKVVPSFVNFPKIN